MPLYCKVSIKKYGTDSESATKVILRDLQHEARRLEEREECEQDPALIFTTPHNWHKRFLDALLRPDDWQPSTTFPFAASDILKLCDLVELKLQAESALLEVHAPIKVFGDIHGQFSDLMHIFRAFGAPSRLGDISCVDYLFLGDYVDRGQHSLETVCLLFALKVEYPSQVHLLRGNHEVGELNKKYGFFKECVSRLGVEEGEQVWQRVNRVFDWLPLAARIDAKMLCLHGGISNTLISCEQIASITLPLQLSSTQPLNPSALLAYKLMWNDPNAHDSVLGSHASSRGCFTETFSAQQVETFCQDNGLDLIIRAHQCVKDGIERFARGRLITVFSATNYCGTYNNAGAVLLVGRDHVVVPKLVHPQPPHPLETSGQPDPALPSPHLVLVGGEASQLGDMTTDVESSVTHQGKATPKHTQVDCNKSHGAGRGFIDGSPCSKQLGLAAIPDVRPAGDCTYSSSGGHFVAPASFGRHHAESAEADAQVATSTSETAMDNAAGGSGEDVKSMHGEGALAQSPKSGGAVQNGYCALDTLAALAAAEATLSSPKALQLQQQDLGRDQCLGNKGGSQVAQAQPPSGSLSSAAEYQRLGIQSGVTQAPPRSGAWSKFTSFSGFVREFMQ